MSNSVIVPPELMQRCRRACERRVENYKNGIVKASSAELAILGIETNVEEQTKSLVAEVGFCLWIGGDVEEINWEPVIDPGWDVPLHGRKYDTKSTGSRGHYLFWPLKKNRFYDQVPFDYLVLVRVDGPRCTVVGYVSKETFWRTHHVAPAGHDLIEGTWFLDANEDELLDPEPLQRWRRYIPHDHPQFMEVRP